VTSLKSLVNAPDVWKNENFNRCMNSNQKVIHDYNEITAGFCEPAESMKYLSESNIDESRM
jgi:hypothetical protein